MARLLVLVALVAVAIWLLRRALAGPPREREAEARPGELVRCAHCGVHLPLAEAREREGRRYCSDEHARLGPREG